MDFWISYIFLGNLEQFVSRARSQENYNIEDIENIHNCSVVSLAPEVLKDISFLFLTYSACFVIVRSDLATVECQKVFR